MKLHNRKPDIENLYKILRNEEPERAAFFELFMNRPLYERLAGRELAKTGDPVLEGLKLAAEAYTAAGYDYAATYGSGFGFEANGRQRKNTVSLNGGFGITGEASYETYTWPEPEHFNFSRLEKIRPFLPEGMKLMVMGPGGVLENVIGCIGFDGKHSYEDAILPAEDSYEKWQGRIAVLGGIDVNFIIRHSEEEISARCRAMLARAEGRGGYALGTGNSVPGYIPQDHFIALLKTGLAF
jgi:uroporphyrinogen decarboxylase